MSEWDEWKPFSVIFILGLTVGALLVFIIAAFWP